VLRHFALLDQSLQKEFHHIGGVDRHPIDAKEEQIRHSAIRERDGDVEAMQQKVLVENVLVLLEAIEKASHRRGIVDFLRVVVGELVNRKAIAKVPERSSQVD
jgi:hypothetical protein